MSEQSPVTFLFTDIEGSTRLWEQESARMPLVMARHDAISKSAVERNRGTIVKMTGDGIHAAFDRPLDALIATLEIQQQLSTAATADGLPLPLRCGLHAGIDERRDGDFYGRSVNRAARIMCAAHGGQMLMSKAVAEQVDGTLPDGASLRDLGVVRLRDLSTPEHIFQLLYPRLRADFPALRSLEGTPNNLTQQLNSFIGRERELAEIREVLASNRLVTLLGMGGIGKSRLSMQLAAEVLDDFSDGVWFVELAALTDPASVPQAVASVLGVKEEAGRPVIEALTKYVRDLQVLVILDNCEQVVHGCADLAKQLLQAGAEVKILTSSRDYLQVAGETAYHVPTLSVPNPTEKIDVAALRQHEAIQLFLDRAAASRRGFHLTGQNAAAVVEICQRLDGIPLALELAAARVRGLSVETIAARLKDRFRLLVTGDQTVLPRQRTLRALIDWSYDLLTAQERTLFQRLSVFAGGWTLDAAETVCTDSGRGEASVLDSLSRLVEKSLVIMEVSERYRMLDTVRHYAQEKLTESETEPVIRRQHLTYFLGLAERAQPQLLGPQQGAWLELIDLERENLLSAHEWCDQADGGAEFGLRLVFALKFYWLNRGLLTLGKRITVHAVLRPGAEQRNFLRCRGLCDAGQICFYLGLYDQAKTFLHESLSIAREIGDRARVVAALQPLGMSCLGSGQSAQAKTYLLEAVQLAEGLGNKRQLAAALNALAQCHRVEQREASALPLYERVIELARALGDQESIAIGLLNLSMVSIALGQANLTREMLLEVSCIADTIGSKPAGQSFLEVCAGLAAIEKDWKSALVFLEAAEVQAADTGLRRDAADEAFLSPLLARVKQAKEEFMLDGPPPNADAYKTAIVQARTWLQTSLRSQQLATHS